MRVFNAHRNSIVLDDALLTKGRYSGVSEENCDDDNSLYIWSMLTASRLLTRPECLTLLLASIALVTNYSVDLSQILSIQPLAVAFWKKHTWPWLRILSTADRFDRKSCKARLQPSQV